MNKTRNKIAQIFQLIKYETRCVQLYMHSNVLLYTKCRYNLCIVLTTNTLFFYFYFDFTLRTRCIPIALKWRTKRWKLSMYIEAIFCRSCSRLNFVSLCINRNWNDVRGSYPSSRILSLQ